VPSKTDDKITSALAVPEMHSRIPRKTIPVHWKESREREGRGNTERIGMPMSAAHLATPLLYSCVMTGCPLVAMTSGFTSGSVFARGGAGQNGRS